MNTNNTLSFAPYGLVLAYYLVLIFRLSTTCKRQASSSKFILLVFAVSLPFSLHTANSLQYNAPRLQIIDTWTLLSLCMVLTYKEFYYSFATYHKRLRPLFILCSQAFIAQQLLSLTLLGRYNSILPGDLFRVTSSTLHISSYLALLLAYKYYRTNAYTDGFFAILGCALMAFSLEKWNYLSLVSCMLFVLLGSVPRTTRPKVVLRSILILSSLILFLLIQITPALNMRGFTSLSDYIEVRVTSTTNQTGLAGAITYSKGNEPLAIGTDLYLKDGGRLSMWTDLLLRSFQHPFTGLGLGARAFSYLGNTIESHNLFIGLIAFFGFPIGSILIITTLYGLKSLLVLCEGTIHLRFGFLAIFNFLFHLSVSTYWARPEVAVMLPLVIIYSKANLHKYGTPHLNQ